MALPLVGAAMEGVTGALLDPPAGGAMEGLTGAPAELPAGAGIEEPEAAPWLGAAGVLLIERPPPPFGVLRLKIVEALVSPALLILPFCTFAMFIIDFP